MDAQEEDRDLILRRVQDDAIRNDDLGYPITIADDTRPAVTQFLREREGRFVVLCDANPHVERLAHAIAKSHRSCLGVRAFALGESHKRLKTLELVLDTLVSCAADRQTLVLGVGGGVASDLFGFAAATFMRGVPYAHFATTLVAMADASIGGKTGVDLRGGKNLAGAFADPLAVFAHVDALKTLPFRSLREGLAEIVKAAVIEGDDLFDSIETLSPHPFWRWPWMEVVAHAVKVKTMIVADDRKEAGMRELLNLGHTFAHGLELASNFRITHGAAVALGLRAAGLLALRTGRFSETEHLRVLATIALLGMPLRTSVPAEDALRAMRSDKKKRNGVLRFVLPRGIGDVEYGVRASERSVLAVLRDLERAPADAG